MDVFHLPVFLLGSAIALGLFSFLAVAAWSSNRRREREAFYRNETNRKIAELFAGNPDAGMALIRELENSEARKRRESLKLGGLMTTAVGVGLLVFLTLAAANSMMHIVAVGLIPLFAGIGLLLYCYVLAPKDK